MVVAAKELKFGAHAVHKIGLVAVDAVQTSGSETFKCVRHTFASCPLALFVSDATTCWHR